MRLAGRLAACLVLCARAASAAAAATAEPPPELEVRPKLCTLAARDQYCETAVQARWHSPRDESLCLVIVGRPEVKRCWEHYSSGLYTLELVFDADLTVELRDVELKNVLAQRTIKVIREALQLRRRRRQPWSILF